MRHTKGKQAQHSDNTDMGIHVCFEMWGSSQMSEVIDCQFLEFAAAPLGPVHFLLPDQQFGIHCLIICAIQLLTPNSSGGT